MIMATPRSKNIPSPESGEGGSHSSWLAARLAGAVLVELHRLARPRNRDLGFGSGGIGFGIVADHLTAFGRLLVGMRYDHRLCLDEVIHNISPFLGAGRKDAADVHHGKLRLVVLADYQLLVGDDAGVAGEVHAEAVRKLKNVAARRA